MVMRAGVLALLLACVSTSTASAFNVKITNQCSFQVQLFDAKTVENVAIGSSITKTIAPNSGAHVFRHSTNAQATLAEFSGDGGMAWFDISIIPTGPISGPDYCNSLEACKAYTGGVGFNVPVQIIPTNQNGGRCRTLTCMADGCPDAYQYPKDDTKTHTCPLSSDFEVIYCPGGAGASTPAPWTPAPTSAPWTPAPTTPAPTTPAPTTPAPTTPAPTTPAPTTPAPTTPAPKPSREAVTESSLLNKSSNSSLAGAANSSSSLGHPETTAENEAGVAEMMKMPVAAVAAPDAANAPAADAPSSEVKEVNTQSASDSGPGYGYIMIGAVAAVACVAGAAIFTVQKKKSELDELDEKSPDPRATMTGGAGAGTMMHTPKDMINVL